MTKFFTIFMKLKLKYLIESQDIKTLKNYLFQNNALISILSKEEIISIINLAIKSKSNALLMLIAMYYKDLQPEEIINLIPASEYETFKYFFLSTIMDGVTYAIDNHKKVLIHSYAKWLNTEPNIYDAKLAKRVLTNDIDYLTIDIALIPAFTSYAFETKILKSPEINYKIEYLRRVEHPEAFLTKLYETKLSLLDYQKLAHSLINHSLLFDYLVNITLTKNIPRKELKSAYLYILFKTYPNHKKSTEIINTIITLNDYPTIKELMKDLKPEVQEKIATHALEEYPLNIIYTLAITTDCPKTPSLIAMLIKHNDFYELVDLLGNLNAKYLEYALKEILNTYGSNYYLSLLNKLYLFGYSNYLSALKLIINTNLKELFPLEIVKKLLHHIQEINSKNTLKRARTISKN